MRRVFSAAVVERHDRSVLIVLPNEQVDSEHPLWCFPRGAVAEDETPEDAARRMAAADLGLVVEIDVGQPPLLGQVDGEEVEFRYMFCGVCASKPRSDRYATLRWVPIGRLAEYTFSSPCDEVVGWMREK